LAELGHRRIAFMGGDLRFAYQLQALDGFRAGLRERGLEHDPRLVVKGRQLKSHLQSLGELPTAIFSIESVGDSVRQTLTELDVETPRQMSILACELAMSPTIVADLSRMELPMDDVGRQAVLLLHRIVAEPCPGSSAQKLFATLVDRGSTRRLEV
jgi:LacI family transcriptional regulator